MNPIAPPPVPALLPEHHHELVIGSGINPEVAALNCRSFGAGAAEHWEDSRTLLIRHKRLSIQTGKLASNGHVQTQAGHVAEALISLQRRYAHLRHGGWRSDGEALPGFDAANCWKPAKPRLNSDRIAKAIKYEGEPGHPRGGGLLLPRVPVAQWRLVCDRAGVPLPPVEVRKAGFWAWLITVPQVPVIIAEGWKKALSAVSAGWAAAAITGVDMGARRRDHGLELIPELVDLAAGRRRLVVVFDRETKPATARRVDLAGRRLAQLLSRAGAVASIAQLPLLPAGKAGIDDVVVALGHQALDQAIAQAADSLAAAAMPWLPPAAVCAPAGQYLSESVTIPTTSKLVAISGRMGCGKTELLSQYLAPLQETGQRVVLISHRRSLGEALAARLGLPWGDDAKPGSDMRQTGVALCLDSLAPGSAMRINPSDWHDCILVIDEVEAVMRHALMGQTAVAKRRVSVLQTLTALLAGARQTLVADAQLGHHCLEALEAAAGAAAFLITSEHKPAAGRQLVVHDSRDSWRSALLQALQRRERVWIATTAAEATSPNSARNLELLAAATWPGCRVLRVDRDSVNDPNHPAYQLAHDPDGVAAQCDVVVASPAVAAGLSVTLKGHFRRVLAIAGGTTDANAVVQAMGRVRDDVPRDLYAPPRSPGNHLLIGSGDVAPDRVLQHLSEHHQRVVGQLAAAGINLETGDSGPWLRLWAETAAGQNAIRQNYSHAVVGLLRLEGYEPTTPAVLDPMTQAAAKLAATQLRDLAQAAEADAHAAVINAVMLTDREAGELEQARRRLSPAEKAQLARWRISKAWGLGQTAPTPAILEAHADGVHHKVVMAWAVTDAAAAPAVAAHDRQQAREQAPAGRAWAPDITAATMGSRVAEALSLGLGQWIRRQGWFCADDPELMRLDSQVSAHRGRITQVLGLRPGSRPTTVLRQLLGLANHRLEARRIKGSNGRDQYAYRVMPSPLPQGITADQLVSAWRDGQTHGPKNPLQKEGQVLAHG
jgi:hypothetical protein